MKTIDKEYTKQEYIELLRTGKIKEFNQYRAKLRKINIWKINLEGANLQGTNLADANLQGTNLRGANLAGADLRGANLAGADLRGAEIRMANLEGMQFTGMEYQLNFWKNQIQIGCKIHLREEWENFSKREILEMDGSYGLQWWNTNRDFVFQISDKCILKYGKIARS